MILKKFSFSWMVDRFFFETLGVSYTDIVKSVAPLQAVQFSSSENLLYKARLICLVNVCC